MPNTLPTRCPLYGLRPWAVLVLLASAAVSAQVPVTTNHNDAARTGANLAETALTAGNIDVTHFGRLYTRTVDDQIYAQPLYVPGVNIPGAGVRNVVFVATVNDSVYAFNADDPAASAPLWQIAYAHPPDVVAVPRADVGQACGTYRDFAGNIGIVGTPVIDQAGQTMYLVAKTKESGAYVQRLHAINITNGTERVPPVTIQASVPGTGDGHNAQNNVTFNARTQNQRAGLLLDHGTVYVAWASHCDQGPYHGWILGYNPSTLQQTFVYNTTPNGGLGGIWMSGGGVSADVDGNLYALTGNGSYSGGTGGVDRGNSFIKVSPTGVLLDWFTPYDWSFLNSTDEDLGIQSALLVPGTNLVVGGGKEGVIYVVDRTSMGRSRASDNGQIVQSFQGSTASRANGSSVYWDGPAYGAAIYLWPAGDPLKVFRLINGRFGTPAAAQSTVLSPGGMPGGMISLSASGSTLGTGVIWAAMSRAGDANESVQPGIVRALDAGNVTRELWNSEMNSTRDRLGNFSKFSPPTVADGKVFVPTFSNTLVAYGLLGGSPGNAAPLVSAGQDQALTAPGTATLTGTASDDGNPNPPGTLTLTWSLVVGPAAISIASPHAVLTNVTFSIDGTYTLRLTAADGATSTSDDVTVVVGSVASAGNGLLGQYFNDAGNGTFFTALTLTRFDPSVDFSWGAGSPGSGVQPDNFSARWTGQVLAPVTDTYTFTTVAEDGVRLWIDDQPVIDNWVTQSVTTRTAAVVLTAGVKYAIRVEFYNAANDATARLLWSYTGQPDQAIPVAQLFSSAAVNQPPAVDAGPDQTITLPAGASLHGLAQDDGLPVPPGQMTVTWSKVSGREESSGGTVAFGNAHALVTTATFGADGTYVLRLAASDGAVTISDDITITVNAVPGGGTGLLGEYFNDPGTTSHFVTPAGVRTDAGVNFSWTGSPLAGVTADNFSVRWTGKVKAPVTGNYIFSTTADDGVRLWVNGVLRIDNWVDQASTTKNSVAVALVAGTLYDVRLEFYDHTQDAVARLLWAYPGQARVAIPALQLYPAPAPPPPPLTGLTGQYYNDPGTGTHFGTLALTRVDTSVNFTWNASAPAAGVTADNFSVRWTGQVQAPASGTFRFTTVANDGIRVWVNGTQVINNFTDHSSTATTTSAGITLAAGVKYAIVIVYYDHTGSATARLQWSYPGQSTQTIPASRWFR